jgi:HAD superfamily hydrolase (TIGR01459 family)
MTASKPELLAHLEALAGRYDLLLCDVWGVIHNGEVAFPEACDALARFRAGGGTVCLITNSPRPSDDVAVQLDALHVPGACYDAIVSSGDVTRSVIAERPGQRAFHLGPERDLPIFAGLDVTRVDAETADYVVCSGLFDDTHETPDDYTALLQKLRMRNLFMLCANPDVMVERGETLIYCAGALADVYAAMGGDVLFAGKPHRPIYERSLARARTIRGGAIAPERILAIGDSIRTDLTGAHAFGVDFLFVASAIHAADFGPGGVAASGAAHAIFGDAPVLPRAVMTRLAW